jgi:zinc transport system substrate-binding protein
LRNMFLFSLIVLLLVSGFNCNDDTVESNESIEVYVTIPPQAYIVEQIGGEHINIHVLVEPGQSPHTFELSPRQMMSLGNAKIYFGAGFPFEKILSKKIQASHPNLIIHNTMPEHDHDRPNSGHYIDPHVWLSPHMVKKIAEDISIALQDINHENATYYTDKLFSFNESVNMLHEQIGEMLAPYKGSAFYVFHPAFGHFADTYGLRQVAVEVEGKSPSPRQIEQLINQAKAEGVQIVFTQPQFDKKSAETIADAIGGIVVSMDPLERDVLQNMQNMANMIEKALNPDSGYNK